MPVACQPCAALDDRGRRRLRVLVRQQHDLLPAARMRARHVSSEPHGQRRRRRAVRGVLPDRLRDPARQPFRTSSPQPHRPRALRLLSPAPVALAEDLLDLLPAHRLLLGDHPGRRARLSRLSVRLPQPRLPGRPGDAGGASASSCATSRPSRSARVWPQAAFTVALQVALWHALDLDWVGWLACYWAFGLNWSSLQYTDHAWSPRDVHEGAWNLRFWPITQAIFLNYNLHLVHHRRPDIPWSHLPRFVSAARSEPVVLVDLLLALGRRAPGAAGRRHRDARSQPWSRNHDRPTARPCPTWRRLLVGIAGAAVVSLVFFPIYVGGAATTGLLDHRLHLYAGWELALPFWPSMVVPYLSMYRAVPHAAVSARRARADRAGPAPRHRQADRRRGLPLPAHRDRLCGADRRRDLATDLRRHLCGRRPRQCGAVVPRHLHRDRSCSRSSTSRRRGCGSPT